MGPFPWHQWCQQSHHLQLLSLSHAHSLPAVYVLSLSFYTSTSCCLCGEFSHVLSFLTMYMSVVMMYMYICKFSVDQIICYFNLHVADPILVVIIVFPFICRCLLPTGTSLLTGALPCESIKSVVNVIHVHVQFL